MDLAKKVNRAKAIIDGMVVSYANFVLFRDEHEVWFQIHLGLWLEMPTVAAIEKGDMVFQEKLESMGVKLIEVETFNSEENMKKVADEIALFIKEKQGK